MDRLKQATNDTRYAAWSPKADDARFRKCRVIFRFPASGNKRRNCSVDEQDLNHGHAASSGARIPTLLLPPLSPLKSVSGSDDRPGELRRR